MENLLEQLNNENIFIALDGNELKINFEEGKIKEGHINQLLLHKQELIYYLKNVGEGRNRAEWIEDCVARKKSIERSSCANCKRNCSEKPSLFGTSLKKEVENLIASFDNSDKTMANTFENLLANKDFMEVEVDGKYTIEGYMEFLRGEVLPNVANIGAPSFIGHMTGPVPKFIRDLSSLVVALNQNQVKIETSFVATLMEKQVLAIFHHLIYQRTQEFYNEFSQKSEGALGVITNGGTLSNIMVLNYIVNSILGPDHNFKGNKKEGLHKALDHYGYTGVALLGSKTAHYSFGKALKLLGIGTDSFIEFDFDDKTETQIEEEIALEIKRLENQNVLILSLIGVAGTTESGMIDPLEVLGKLSHRFGLHFHVDAAFGGAYLLENSLRPKLKGIEMADSVSICAHKQLYLPIGLSLCLFKDPQFVVSSENNTYYQARKGSFDLGKYTIEGTKNFMSLILHAIFHTIGKNGYGKILKCNYDNAQYFSNLIDDSPEFQLLYDTQMNIVLYRYLPEEFRGRSSFANSELKIINELNFKIQKEQLKQGKSFVSYTEIKKSENTIKHLVFRTVFMNPSTTHNDLTTILEEQKYIAFGLEEKRSSKFSIA